MSERSADGPYLYKGKRYKRPPVARVENDFLETWDYLLDRKIQKFHIGKSKNFKYWMYFLETEKSFRYIKKGVSMTVIKERRGTSLVWYGHKKRSGKLHRKYIGVSENLTPQKLHDTAFFFGARKIILAEAFLE